MHFWKPIKQIVVLHLSQEAGIDIQSANGQKRRFRLFVFGVFSSARGRTELKLCRFTDLDVPDIFPCACTYPKRLKRKSIFFLAPPRFEYLSLNYANHADRVLLTMLSSTCTETE